MTTPEWNDPFQTVREPSKSMPVPLNAPPPTGPQFGAAPLPGDTAWRGAAAAPPPDWNALQPSKRTWNVTMKRWGYGWLVGILGGLLAGVLAEGAFADDVWGYGAEDAGYFTGTVTGLAIMYVLLVAWWLDHVIAGAGPRAVLAIHTVAATGLGAFQYSNPAVNEFLPFWFAPLLGLTLTPLAVLAASRVKGSFESGPQRDEVQPWGPGRS